MEPDVGGRIRRLREAAGIQAQELAARVGLDATALSKIENGRRAVKSVELARLAEGLKVSPLALLEDDPILARLPEAARQAGPSISAGGAYDRLLSLTELHVVLADAGLHTSPDLASVPTVHGLGWLEAAETLARWAAAELHLEVDGDHRLEALADAIETRMKVDVLIDAFSGDPLSGAAITDRSFPLIFVNGDHPRPRALFTLGHELGHLLAGDPDGNITLDRELAGSTDTERLANAFAAHYLLPEAEVREAFDSGPSISTLVRLSGRYGVGYETVLYRLRSLRLIGADERSRLMATTWEQLVAESAPDLRAQGLDQPERGRLFARSQLRPAYRPPALLVRRAFDGFRKGIVSIRPLAGLLHETPEDLSARLTSVDDLPATIQHRRDTGHLRSDEEGDDTTEDLFSGSPV